MLMQYAKPTHEADELIAPSCQGGNKQMETRRCSGTESLSQEEVEAANLSSLIES